MIDSREYPPESEEDECQYCWQPCNGEFCSKECEKAYKSEN